METVTIKGVTYTVMQADTPDGEAAAGRPNLAAHMRKAGVIRSLWLRRPAGNRMYTANEYGPGRYSTVSNVGHW